MNIIWKLIPKCDELNYTDLVVKIANNQDINLRDYDVAYISSVVHSFKDEIIDYILEHGLSSLINSEPILEHFVVKGESPNKIVSAMHRYLDKVGIDNELIIIDPYFLTSSDSTYPNLVDQIISKYLSQLDTIIIITFSNNVNATVKANIELLLKTRKPTLSIVYKTSDDYHDRFWISNHRANGILTGTSINGFGKRYALLERLNTNDVGDIVKSLNTHGLI
jgi:hypothetical protein